MFQTSLYFVSSLLIAYLLVSQGSEADLQIREPRDKPWLNDEGQLVKVKSLEQLPKEFSMTDLPDPVQTDREGNAIRFDYLDVVTLLTDKDPDNPFSIDTKFHLFSGGSRRVVPFKIFKSCLLKKQDECKKLPVDLNKILEIYNPNRRTVIIIGGFLTPAPSDWQLRMADKWLKLDDVNVIIVGWNKGNKFFYDKAVRNTKVVARQVTVFLYYLARLYRLNPRDRKFTENLIIVGHSLGAHIAGFIGQDFGGKIGRITGLDPAGPSFSQNSESRRLDRNDAIVVDVIHTNADFGYKFFLGIYAQIGHVDYYANDGKWQPNCHLINFYECNHGAVINYYLSILDHEIVMRSYFDTFSRNNYRVVAYLSKSYDDFRTGASLDKYCPNMSRDGYDTIYQSGIDFDRCGVPMDFIKPAREWRHELNQRYNIDFSPSYRPTEKFYFFTSAKAPFVVDHNLLKVSYDLAENFDPKKSRCGIKITYTMLDGEKLTAELPKFEPNPSEPDRSTSTLPFVVPTQVGRYMLINVDSTNYFSDEALDKADEEIIRNAYKIFPASMEITTFGTLPSNKEKSSAMISRWLFSGPGNNLDKPLRKDALEMQQLLGTCTHSFKTVRVQPLRKTNRLFMAIYTQVSTLPHGDPSESGTFKPKIIRLGLDDKVPYIELPEKLSNPKLYLDTIIIGANHYSVMSRGLPESSPTPYSNFLTSGAGHPVYSKERNSDMGQMAETYWADKNKMMRPSLDDVITMI